MLGIATVVVVGAVAAGGIALAAPKQPAPADTAAPPEKTATVERGDLAITKEVEGQISFDDPRQITVRKEGTITWLPAVGTVVHRGEPLVRVDDRAVPLFVGATPLYRTLDGSGLSGADVDVVAANLVALGHLSAFPDGDITGPLFARAVARWRTALGLAPVELSPPPGQTDDDGADEGGGAGGGTAGGDSTPPGENPAPPPAQTPEPPTTMSAIEAGDVIVSASEVRVSGVRAQLGAPALDAVVLDVTSTLKTVTLDADAAQDAPLSAGQAVTIVLPGGGETAGTVRSVGAAVTTEDGVAGPSVIIDVADQAALDGVDGGPVSVRVTSDSRQDVLTVPVSALLALSEGGYALERADGSLVAVTTGLFTDQRVEVSGEGITEGLVVVDAT